MHACTIPVRAFFSAKATSLKVKRGAIPRAQVARNEHKFLQQELQEMFYYADTYDKALLSLGVSIGYSTKDFLSLERSNMQALVEQATKNKVEFPYFDSHRAKTNVVCRSFLMPECVKSLKKYFETTEPNKEDACMHVAVEINRRYDSRDTLKITDEYDVQDLLRGLLRLHFDDIRKEEWTLSYAGGSTRIDFLLKQELIAIETKMTRKGLTARKLGDELIVDIAHYQKHPDCKTLYCFVYDPEERLSNPRGLETDLTRKHEKLDVKVFIMPRRT